MVFEWLGKDRKRVGMSKAFMLTTYMVNGMQVAR